MGAPLARCASGGTRRDVRPVDPRPTIGYPGSGRIDDGKELAPRADRLGVLLGHRLDDLTEVIQIVHHPRGEELAERHLPKGGMETPWECSTGYRLPLGSVRSIPANKEGRLT